MRDARCRSDNLGVLRTSHGFGAARATGIALRAAGVVQPGASGLPLLQRAAAVLSQSPARLEHARALVDLGATLRRAGERAHAREPLREGLAVARECGASAVAARARAELLVAGARPRRDAVRGHAALTASETRIARMAADGLTNREIAQALFITTKTVETHLRHTFHKLDVNSRRGLEAALAARPPRSPLTARNGDPESQGALPDAKPASASPV